MDTRRCEQQFSQPSGSRERAKSIPQQPISNKAGKQVNGKEDREVRAATATPDAPPNIQCSGSAPDVEKARRKAKYRDRYQAFLVSAEKRRLQRKELETRTKVWQEARNKAQARIEAIDRERQAILQKLNAMEAATDSYHSRNAVQVSGERDQETRRKWEAYFNLETDALDL